MIAAVSVSLLAGSPPVGFKTTAGMPRRLRNAFRVRATAGGEDTTRTVDLDSIARVVLDE
ncbi:MAG: hypothetical protein ACI9OJ_005085 [Myxococcota bacterium]